MMIEWLVTDGDGREVASGKFHDGSPRGRNRFATRMRQAWEDGHAVISRQLPDTRTHRPSPVAPLVAPPPARVVEDAGDDAVRMVDAPPSDGAVPPVISRFAALVLWTLTVGSAAFMFGAAWRGSQIVGG